MTPEIPDNVRTIRRPELAVIEGDGPPPTAAKVRALDSFGMCEDGKTLQVTVELVDGRLAMFQFCPGEQVTACVVA